MKNLTATGISLFRQNGTRAYLPASPVTPTVEDVAAEVVGYLGGLEIIRQAYKRVHLYGLADNLAEQPFVVSREVFDALPYDAIEFVTPDYDSAMLNGLGIPHVIRRFIAKQAVTAVPEKPFPVSSLNN